MNALAAIRQPCMIATMDIIRSGINSTHANKGSRVMTVGKRPNQKEAAEPKTTLFNAAKHDFMMKLLNALVRNHAAHLSWRGEWLSQSLENCGSVRREPCGLNSKRRQEMANDSKGMTQSVSKLMIGSASFAGFTVGGGAAILVRVR